MSVKGKVHKHVAQIYAVLILSLILFLAAEKSLMHLSYSEELLTLSLFYIIDFAVLILFVRFIDRTSFPEMGFTSKNAAIALVSGFTASAGYIILVPLFGIPPSLSFDESLLLLLTCFLVGLTEEGFFRGYIQGKLKMVHGDLSAIVYTAILFAVAHIPSYVVSYEGGFLFIVVAAEAVRSITILGALFGFLYETLGNIWCVIIAHATWDFYLMLFPPTSLDITSLLTFLTLSTISTSGTLGLSFILAFETTKAPIVFPLGSSPEKPLRETTTLNERITEKIMENKSFPQSDVYNLSEFKFCPYCGKSLPLESLYCPYCGKQIGIASQQPPFIEEKAETLSGPSLPPPPPPPPQPRALVYHLWPEMRTSTSETGVTGPCPWLIEKKGFLYQSFICGKTGVQIHETTFCINPNRWPGCSNIRESHRS